jgi:predicted HicB family RNase H-like nuclease
MTDNEFLAKLDALPAVKPDAEDLAMLEMVRAQDETERSGRIILRLPKSLHKELINAAKHEGVSLNQYCLYRLASRQS